MVSFIGNEKDKCTPMFSFIGNEKLNVYYLIIFASEFASQEIKSYSWKLAFVFNSFVKKAPFMKQIKSDQQIITYANGNVFLSRYQSIDSRLKQTP